MKESAAVSVIIPCYNGAAFLRETLESALAQTLPPLEIIVIDDGSTDESAAIADSFGAPVRVLRQKNQGESVARNRGIDEARGSHVAFLDADDLWEPGKLAAQVACFAREPGLACVYTDFLTLCNGVRSETEPRPDSHAGADYRVRMLLEWSVLPSTAMVPRELAARVRFSETVRDSEDILFFLELRDHGPFEHVRQPLSIYRRSSGQQTSRPGHLLRSTQALFEWFNGRRSSYSAEEATAIRRGLIARLEHPHQSALWLRDLTVVKRCRKLCAAIAGDDLAMPPAFTARLHPAWLYRLKDLLDGSRNRLQESRP